MISFRELVSAFRSLELDGRPAIAHASLSAFGDVRGGAETLLGALLTVQPAVMMPTFTYRTMLTPETGPEHNGMTYGACADGNRMAEFYRRNMPADRLMGALPEALRQHPQAQRSVHPILSFAGVGVDEALASQTLTAPLAPIAYLERRAGWVLLMGVDQTVNTSIHYAEQLSGRKQFLRWALTSGGVRECPSYPGCSQGFNAVEPYLQAITRETRLGRARIRAIPMDAMVQILRDLLATDPLAFLCGSPDCERCADVRQILATPAD